MVAQSCKYSKTDWIVQFAKYIFAGQYVWSLSRVWLLATPWTVAHQAPLFVRFPRQEYWSGLPFPCQGIFLTQGSNLQLLPHLLYWQAESLPLCYWGSPLNHEILNQLDLDAMHCKVKIITYAFSLVLYSVVLIPFTGWANFSVVILRWHLKSPRTCRSISFFNTACGKTWMNFLAKLILVRLS